MTRPPLTAGPAALPVAIGIARHSYDSTSPSSLSNVPSLENVTASGSLPMLLTAEPVTTGARLPAT